MRPGQLTAASFAAYPATARRIATTHLALLQRLPLSFVPLLLRELIVYDWKFPAERQEIDGQFAYLKSLSPEQLAKAMAPFSQLQLTDAFEKIDWVNSPPLFTEQLTAHLWSTHQIDAFRAGAVAHIRNSSEAFPEAPLQGHRLGIAVIGHGVTKTDYRLFRKLRPHGTYFTRVQSGKGLGAIIDAVGKRSAAAPLPYGHWYIDGAAPSEIPDGITAVSYAALAAPRAALQGHMQKIYEASVFDPEAFRTRMARVEPSEIGLPAAAGAVLTRFQLSLLTEGSGTQVFATTFVQWAAREALRRARPMTLLARFGERQRDNPMNILLAEARRRPELDPQGSLVDADMGAYYTWVNQQRLAGADRSAFLAWFEDHDEAVAIGPGFTAGRQADTPIELRELLDRLA